MQNRKIIAATVATGFNAILVLPTWWAVRQWDMNHGRSVESRPPNDAEIHRYLDNRRYTQQARLFDYYVESHTDTPGPRFELPSVDVVDPAMWDWTVHAIIRHERLVSHWNGDTPEGMILSTAVTTGQFQSIMIPTAQTISCLPVSNISVGNFVQ